MGYTPRVGRRPRWGVLGVVLERLGLGGGNLAGVVGGERGRLVRAVGFADAGVERLGRDILMRWLRFGKSSTSSAGSFWDVGELGVWRVQVGR